MATAANLCVVRLALTLAVVFVVACEVPMSGVSQSRRMWPSSGGCSTTGGCSAILDRDGTFVFRPVSPPLDGGPPLVLEVKTPWGTTLATHRSREGAYSSWTFAIDFTTDLDLATPQTRALMAQPWTIRSISGPEFKARWIPNPQDVTLTLALMASATERIVTGPIPARVVTTGIVFEPNVLVAGRSVNARVDIENTGGSSARDVVVTTRSSVGALHNQRFAFGNVRPGKRKSQSLRMLIPSGVTGDSVTVVVVVDEAEGHGQPEITQTVKLVSGRSCPEGRFSRERYDAKRAKLLKAVADGSMTQAEFDSYDAELVRCLD